MGLSRQLCEVQPPLAYDLVVAAEIVEGRPGEVVQGSVHGQTEVLEPVRVAPYHVRHVWSLI